MRKFLFTAIVLISILVPNQGQSAFPKPSGFVNDYAGVINSNAKAILESSLQAVERQTGVEITVVTVESLDGRPVEDYAVDLYQKWGIGKKDTDEGVLILVAPNDRSLRIEVGYGLEGAINDAQAGRIIRNYMIPYFKKSDFSGGITEGTKAVITLALKEKGLDPKDIKISGGYNLAPQKKKEGPLSTVFKIFLFLIMAYLFIRHPWLFLFFLMSGGRGSVGSRGGFSGGFGGFGGGLSGGGGASGRW